MEIEKLSKKHPDYLASHCEREDCHQIYLYDEDGEVECHGCEARYCPRCSWIYLDNPKDRETTYLCPECFESDENFFNDLDSDSSS